MQFGSRLKYKLGERIGTHIINGMNSFPIIVKIDKRWWIIWRDLRSKEFKDRRRLRRKGRDYQGSNSQNFNFRREVEGNLFARRRRLCIINFHFYDEKICKFHLSINDY